MVVNQLRQMSEDNQLLVYLKDRDVKKQKQTKALKESLDIVTEKLRRTMQENRIVRSRTKMQHEENKEEVTLWWFRLMSKLHFGFASQKRSYFAI